MDQETIYQTIARQIKEVYGVTEFERRTSINSFNAVSEDNEEFLTRFQNEFQVDMNGFNYYDFFDEDQFYILALVNRIMRLFKKPKAKSQITIQHLINVAQTKKWSRPS